MRFRRFSQAMIWALVAAAALGFALGWYARIWYAPTPEAKAREAAHDIQERVRSWTH